MAPALEPLFVELREHIKEAQYSKALDVCDRILSESNEDGDALHCRVLCLLYLNRSEEAVQQIADRESVIGDRLAFERIYCLYKLRRHDEALRRIEELLAKAEPEGKVRLQHLKAQILYREERFEEARSLYGSLLQNCSESDEKYAELIVNYAAASAGLGQMDSTVKKVLAKPSSYELSYNIACNMIRMGDLQSAESMLRAASTMCEQSLSSSGYSTEEIADELAVIQVQLAYVEQLKGKNPFNLYQQVIQKEISDAAVKAVAENNLVSLSQDQKLFQAEHKLHSALSAAVAPKLSAEQQRIIAGNRAIVLLKMGKVAESAEALSSFEAEFKDSSLPILLKAAMARKKNDTEESLSILQQRLASSPNDLAVRMTVVNLHLINSDVDKALEALEQISADKQRNLPGVVCTKYTIFKELKEQPEKASAVLLSALDYWSNADGGEQIYVNLLRAAAEHFSGESDNKNAEDCYKKLMEIDPLHKDQHRANLIIMLSKNDPDAAEKYGAGFSASIDISKINAEALEKERLPTVQREVKRGELTESSKAAETKAGEKKKKTKRKRKPRVAKNMVGAPDPERWKPRHLRSNYRRKGKGKPTRGGHQGADLGGTVDVSISKTEKTGPAARTSTTTTTTAPQQAKKGPQGRKKKGRR